MPVSSGLFDTRANTFFDSGPIAPTSVKSGPDVFSAATSLICA
jgi:hypothetical protein